MKQLSLFIPFLLFLSCKKDDTNKQFALPPKTQTGPHTFGFLLNSNVWTNYRKRCTFYGCADNLVGTYYSNGDISVLLTVFFLKMVRVCQLKVLVLVSPHFRRAGTCSILNKDSLDVGYTFSDTSTTERYYILSQTNPVFTVTITKIDTVNKILSGEFSGKLLRKTSLSGNTTSVNQTLNYRIRLIASGKQKFSRIIQLKPNGKAEDLNVLNPFSGKLVAQINISEAQLVHLSLIDNSGKIVRSHQFALINGNNNLQINDTGNLPKGLYTLQVQFDTHTISKKVIKQ